MISIGQMQLFNEVFSSVAVRGHSDASVMTSLLSKGHEFHEQSTPPVTSSEGNEYL